MEFLPAGFSQNAATYSPFVPAKAGTQMPLGGRPPQQGPSTRTSPSLGPRVRARACTHLRECWSAAGQSGATAFPPPLWGRDRERGTTSTASVSHLKSNTYSQPRFLGLCTGPSFMLCASLPPLSLSLPHKGGGNRVARTFVTHSTRLRHFQRSVHALAPARGRQRTVISFTSSCAGTNGESSFHRWNHELGAFLDAGGPARGDGLGLGVEADRVRAVLVEVAEARPLPAAERVIGERHRDREVDAHHAHFDTAREITGRVAIAREDGDTIAVVVLGGKPQRLFVVLGAYDRQHRPEDLLLVDAHVGRHLVEQAAAHEEAVLVALQLEAAAVDLELRAFLDAEIDVVFHPIELRLGDHRAVVGLRVSRGPDLEALDP